MSKNFFSHFYKIVLSIFIVVSIILLVVCDDKLLVLTGFVIGSFVSTFKFVFAAKYLKGLLLKDPVPKSISSKAMLQFGAYMFLVAFLMFVSVTINISLFIGVSSGILLLPFVIFFICISRRYDILNKNF